VEDSFQWSGVTFVRREALEKVCYAYGWIVNVDFVARKLVSFFLIKMGGHIRTYRGLIKKKNEGRNDRWESVITFWKSQQA